jgi:hypothetical protein
MRVTLMTDSKAELLLAQVCHARKEQSRCSKAEELQIDQNQCRRLKGYYGFDHPKSVAEPATDLSRAS